MASVQDGFCRDGRLFVFDRVTGNLRRDRPTNVAAITHAYTIHRDGGVKGTRAEEYFARLDGTAVPIAAKLRNHVPLTVDERQSFAWYLACFAARVLRSAIGKVAGFPDGFTKSGLSEVMNSEPALRHRLPPRV